MTSREVGVDTGGPGLRQWERRSRAMVANPPEEMQMPGI